MDEEPLNDVGSMKTRAKQCSASGSRQGESQAGGVQCFLEAEETGVDGRYHHWWRVTSKRRDLIDTSTVTMYASPLRLCPSSVDV